MNKRCLLKKMLFTALLLVCIACFYSLPGVYAGTESADHEPENEIYYLQGSEKIRLSKAGDELYLFLPAEADMTDLHLHTYDEGLSCSIVDIDPGDGTVYSARVRLSADDWTDPREYTVNIMQGSGIGTVFFDSKDPVTEGRTFIDQAKANSTSGTGVFTDSAGNTMYEGKVNDIHIRGATSLRDPKKSYAVKLDKKAALAGSKAGKKWVLLAQYKDPLKMSDKLFKEMAAISGDTYAASETWVNFYYDGEYRGVYLLSEKNEIKSNRIDITDMEKAYEEQDPDYGDVIHSKTSTNAYGNVFKYQDGLEGPERLGGYLFEMDDQYMDENNGFFFVSGGSKRHAEISSPELGSKEAVQYISEYFQEFCDAVDTPDKTETDGKNEATGLYYYDYCDIDSLVNTYLMHTIGSNTDAFWKSQYFYKDAGKKMVSGPIWDMDMTLGTGWSYQPDPNADILAGQVLTRGLIKIPSFRKLLKERYFSHYQEVLDSLLGNGDKMPSFMDTYNSIKVNLLMDEVIWPVKLKLGSDKLPDPSVGQWEEGTTFDDIAAYRVNWIQRHKEFLDTYFENMDAEEAHLYGDVISVGQEQHKRVCEWCGDVLVEDHIWGDGKITSEPTCKDAGTAVYECRLCVEQKEEALPLLPHTLKYIEARPATYDEEGTTGYYKCEECGKLFADEEATKEISEQDIIDPVVDRTDISAAEIKVASVKYSGNAASPAPVVTLDGTELVQDKDYAVHYDGRKAVGTAKLTIEGIGTYKGEASANYKIIPKGSGIYKLTSSKKAMTVKWKKQTAKMSKTRITGYNIQYCTDKTFGKTKKNVYVKGYKKTSKKIKGLKSGKYYYVHVRTYKKVNGIKYYSAWSKTWKVKIK